MNYKLKLGLYNFLVNRHSGIRERYKSYHEGVGKDKKLMSWLYLLALNFCYYVLFVKFIGRQRELPLYEEKSIPFYEKSESLCASEGHPDVEELVSELERYDVISFDIFDTLIFRPFSEPTDLFYFLGERLEFMDMKRIRTQAEADAREINFSKKHHHEITLEDIWRCIEEKTGIPYQKGMEEEMRLELQFCFANPFMKHVYERLVKMNKKIIAVSDMYLTRDFLKKILNVNGYEEISEIFVSCEYGKSKADGRLYECVLQSEKGKIIHVGDNIFSDVKMSEKYKINSIYYPNINGVGKPYRPYDMSYITGSAYRGLVNSHLLSGNKIYSVEYEYGFTYGGLFVVGYCSFIHDYAVKNNVDRLLFLSRDGDILKQVYDYIYDNEDTKYFYWSRRAAVKLMARYDKYDYFRRFLYHNVNTGKTIADILKQMELDDILRSWRWSLKTDGELTEKNVEALKKIIEESWDMVLRSYKEQQEATEICLKNTLKNCKRVCAVDIGWAGSGAMSLRRLAKESGIDCEIIGIVAGTNTVHNEQPDASEPFLQSGMLVSYMYSQAHNRDLLKKHDLNKGWNLFWELILSSPQSHFTGYYPVGETQAVELKFSRSDTANENADGIRQIQQGIFDFAHLYMRHFKDVPYMLSISGRDAYAPVLAAAGNNEKFLREVYKKFYIDSSI